MKEKFQELYETLKLDRKNSEFSKKQDFRKRLQELKGEVEEAIEAYESGDMEHFKDELGDIYCDLTFLVVLAEEKGTFNGKEVMEANINKFKRRKPWIFTGEKLDSKEEHERWEENKRREKGWR